jgi:tetratricopeptide (TPR) repeat protein
MTKVTQIYQTAEENVEDIILSRQENPAFIQFVISSHLTLTAANLFTQRGLNNLQTYDISLAILDFKQALQLMPNATHAYEYLALAEFTCENWADAVAAYASFIERCPTNVSAHQQCGIAQYKLGNFWEALSHFNSAIQHQSPLLRGNSVYYQRALTYVALDNPKDALADLTLARQKNPNDADINVLMALSLFKLHEEKEGLIFLKRAKSFLALANRKLSDVQIAELKAQDISPETKQAIALPYQSSLSPSATQCNRFFRAPESVCATESFGSAPRLVCS